MVRLLLCRHGQTEWNVAHRFQGQTNSNLTPLGEQQAVKLGERLAETHIDAVYSSSLQRALDTAKLIVGKRGFDIIPVDALKEIYLGKLEGLTFEEGERLYPEAMMHFWGLTSNTDEREAVGDVMRRASQAIEEIAQKHPDQTVLIVTHGVVLRSLYIYFKRWDMKDASNQPKPQSTCLCDIRKEAGVWDIKMWNDTEHLNDLVSANTHPFI